jgi:hypothetical protein
MPGTAKEKQLTGKTRHAAAALLAVALTTLAFVKQPAGADDFNSIQAPVTLNANESGMTNRGVFHTVHVIEDKRYAFVEVSYGSQGFAGTEYLMKETPGGWSIVAGPAKDMFTVDMLLGPVSEKQANLLEGADCPSTLFPGGAESWKRQWLANHGVRPGKASWRVIAAVQPPTETVTATDKGKLVQVRIVRSHDAKLCLP